MGVFVLVFLANIVQLLSLAFLLFLNRFQLFQNIPQLTAHKVAGGNLTQGNTQRGDLTRQILCLLKVLLVTFTVLGGDHTVTVILPVLRQQQQGSSVRCLQGEHQGEQGKVEASRVKLQLFGGERVPPQPHATENSHPQQKLGCAHVPGKPLGHTPERIRVRAVGEPPHLTLSRCAQLRLGTRTGLFPPALAALGIPFGVFFLQPILQDTRLINARVFFGTQVVLLRQIGVLPFVQESHRRRFASPQAAAHRVRRRSSPPPPAGVIRSQWG